MARKLLGYHNLPTLCVSGVRIEFPEIAVSCHAKDTIYAFVCGISLPMVGLRYQRNHFSAAIYRVMGYDAKSMVVLTLAESAYRGPTITFDTSGKSSC
ncbi:MAG: hypothetical protein KDB03_13435 [Planctomycetales bacterium]|nr:hypothetical protein [Planctomycetales bacterium]